MPYDIIIGRNKEDKKRFKNKGLIYIGKGYVQMGNYTSLSNKIWLDVARSHVVLIAGKRGCLTGDTLVMTNNGYKCISNFNEKEDMIFSYNLDDKKFELEDAKLLHYDITNNEKLLEIEFIDGKKLRLTKEHPLLAIINTNNLISLSYTNANKLKKEDEILSIKNSLNDLIPLKIKSIKEIDGVKKVYDLSVNKNHSFIANGIISHNSGKSYSIGVIAEELSDLPEDIKYNIAPIIFDTMGIFWTMKFKNEKEIPLLEEWNLKTKNLPSTIWVPYGYYSEYEKRGIPIDKKFALAASELDIEDWISIFELSMIEPVSVFIQKVISELREKGKFDLDTIIETIKEESANEKVKESAMALFEAAKSWKVFAPKGEEGTKINELIVGGKTTILDLSVYPSTAVFNVRALIIGLISKKLFLERMLARKKEEIDTIQYGLDSTDEKKETPLVWIFLDEAHEFLPMNSKTPATNSLLQLLREGRQPGVSLVLATQQPGVIHRDVMTQSDVVISHRLTNKNDMEALNEIMQSYYFDSIQKSMNNLPGLSGSALVLDDNSERLYPIRVRPRFTWHGGETPTAIKEKTKF